jgi:hypothetical protein
MKFVLGERTRVLGEMKIGSRGSRIHRGEAILDLATHPSILLALRAARPRPISLRPSRNSESRTLRAMKKRSNFVSKSPASCPAR